METGGIVGLLGAVQVPRSGSFDRPYEMQYLFTDVLLTPWQGCLGWALGGFLDLKARVFAHTILGHVVEASLDHELI